MQPGTSAGAIERGTREKYSGAAYDPEHISHLPPERPEGFSDILLKLRIDTVRAMCTPSTRLLDVCCASGEHLLHLAGAVDTGVGVDFSQQFVDAARRRALERAVPNAAFIHEIVRAHV